MVCYCWHNLQSCINIKKSYHRRIYRRGPSIEPCGTPYKISSQRLDWSFVFTFCFVLLNNLYRLQRFYGKTICMKLRSCAKQSKALERSVTNASYSFAWSIVLVKLFIMTLKIILGAVFYFVNRSGNLNTCSQSKIYQNTHFTKIFQRLVYISFKRKICK